MAAGGETPLSDFDGLRKRHIRTRGQLAVAGAENIRRAVLTHEEYERGDSPLLREVRRSGVAA